MHSNYKSIERRTKKREMEKVRRDKVTRQASHVTMYFIHNSIEYLRLNIEYFFYPRKARKNRTRRMGAGEKR